MNRVVWSLLLWAIVTIRRSSSISDELCSGKNGSTDIHIIGFFPCTHSNDTRGIPVDNCDGIDRIPIMKLALEEINERCDLLPGYRLVVDYANSGVSQQTRLVSCSYPKCNINKSQSGLITCTRQTSPVAY